MSDIKNARRKVIQEIEESVKKERKHQTAIMEETNKQAEGLRVKLEELSVAAKKLIAVKKETTELEYDKVKISDVIKRLNVEYKALCESLQTETIKLENVKAQRNLEEKKEIESLKKDRLLVASRELAVSKTQSAIEQMRLSLEKDKAVLAQEKAQFAISKEKQNSKAVEYERMVKDSYAVLDEAKRVRKIAEGKEREVESMSEKMLGRAKLVNKERNDLLIREKNIERKRLEAEAMFLEAAKTKEELDNLVQINRLKDK